MLRLVVANGCSCTRGEELERPEHDAWPVALGRLLGVDVLNIARDGSSNRRLVRSSAAALDGIAADRGLAPHEVLVLTAWTQLSRSEYFSATEPEERRDGTADWALDRGWQRIGPWRDRARHRPTRAFYRHLWSEEGQFMNFAVDWALFEGWCRSRGFRSAYAFAFPLPQVRFVAGGPSEAAVRTLPLDKTWGAALWAPGASMLEMPDAHRRGAGGHPLETGHAWFAGQLATWLGPGLG